MAGASVSLSRGMRIVREDFAKAAWKRPLEGGARQRKLAVSHTDAVSHSNGQQLKALRDGDDGDGA